MVPSVYFCSVSTHQVSVCKYHLPLFCCWVPCIHLVWGNETGTHVKNRPAKLALDGDHVLAAFPSSSLHHIPVSSYLAITRPSVHSVFQPPSFHWDSLHSAWLQALLSSLFLMWQDGEWLLVYIYHLLIVSLGHCYPGAFQQPGVLLEACDSLLPLYCSVITGVMSRVVLERWSW